MMLVFNALNAGSDPEFFRNFLAPAAKKRFVNRADFLSAEFHEWISFLGSEEYLSAGKCYITESIFTAPSLETDSCWTRGMP